MSDGRIERLVSLRVLTAHLQRAPEQHHASPVRREYGKPPCNEVAIPRASRASAAPAAAFPASSSVSVLANSASAAVFLLRLLVSAVRELRARVVDPAGAEIESAPRECELHRQNAVRRFARAQQCRRLIDVFIRRDRISHLSRNIGEPEQAIDWGVLVVCLSGDLQCELKGL